MDSIEDGVDEIYWETHENSSKASKVGVHRLLRA